MVWPSSVAVHSSHVFIVDRCQRVPCASGRHRSLSDVIKVCKRNLHSWGSRYRYEPSENFPASRRTSATSFKIRSGSRGFCQRYLAVLWRKRPQERVPDPTPLSHSWHALSCRYLALNRCRDICPIFRKRWKQLRRAENIKMHTILFAEFPGKGRGRGGGGNSKLHVSVGLNWRLAGGASSSPLPLSFINQNEEKCCGGFMQILSGNMWKELMVSHYSRDKRGPICPTNKVVIAKTPIMATFAECDVCV